MGEVETHDVRQGSAILLRNVYVYDDLGRIDARAETVNGTTKNYEYLYDGSGRLEYVYVNGVLRSHYGYDANGNRLAATVEGVAVSGTYDAQDRVESYGGRVFEYDRNGNITKV